MTRYAAFVLLLAAGIVISCGADQAITPPPATATATATTPAPATTAAPATTPAPATTASPATTPAPATTTAPATTAAPATTTASTTTAAPTTTEAPTTTTAAPVTNETTTAPVTNETTTAPVTNATTAAPVTNTTTVAPPTTTPAPTLPPPNTGNYSVKSDNNTVCMMANFGLRIGLKQGETYQEMNLDPNKTLAAGSCGVNSSELQLVSDTMTIVFTFINDTAKFRLHAVNFTAKTSSGDINLANTSLTLWEATIGSSYMCNKEQNYTITNQLSFYTFNLQVQPFGITKGVFSTAHECSLDDTSILIPIIVGAALAGLILIVVIAYVIGRRKTYVGYQTL